MKFIEKIKRFKITHIDYYKEGLGMAFISNDKYYFTNNMKVEFWTCYACKPPLSSFAGIEDSTIYFNQYPEGFGGPVINKLYNIEKNNESIFHIKLILPATYQMNSFRIVKKNYFTIYTIDLNESIKAIIYNQKNNEWKWFEGSWQWFVNCDRWFYASNENRLSLIAYNLNTFEPLWKTSLEPYSRYKENLNDTVYNPGRLADFIGLFGNELILLVTNQMLLAVDVITGAITWNSEPMLNYDPESKFTFNPTTQQYTWKQEHLANINIEAVKEGGVLHHGPLMFS